MKHCEDFEREIISLRTQLLTANYRIRAMESVIDKLKSDRELLVTELRHERNKVNFLQGFDGLGHGPWDIRRLF